MNKILSFFINLLLLVISDAVPLKLIAGDRSVVKKDGATHTISKYYVVPNDYDPNNVTNTTAATQKATLRMHSLYSKSMDSGSIDEEISENKTTTVNDQSDSDVNVDKINAQANFRSVLRVGQGEVSQQPDDRTESTVSMSTEQTLDADDLGNLQVEPIINPINISRIAADDQIDINVNSAVAMQNRSALIIINATDYQNKQTFEKDTEDELDDLILSKFGIAVHESYSQNLESFWKLIKLKIDKNLDDDELLATVERLSLLLNIFTNLYEAAQLQKPVETMIDGIIEILQIPYVEKSNGDESQAETNISGDYNEECLRKCGGKSSIYQLDSNGTYLSETEGKQASDSVELENLQRRQRGDSDDDDLIQMSDDPDLNQVTVSNEPTNVLRGQFPVPYNLNVGVPDGYNVLTSMTTPNLNDIARNNNIQEDPNSIQNIPDSTDTVENLDDQPVTVKSRLIDLLPLTLESRTADDLPWTNEDKTTEYFPWTIQTTANDGLPWHIEDKTSAHYPFTIAHRTTNKVPWNIKSRSDPTWTIENKMGHSPITKTTFYQSIDPSVTTHGGNILLNPIQSIKSTIHSVKNRIKKPYHIYTYVISPTTTLYEVPHAGSVVQMVSRQPHENLGTTLYGLPTLHGGNKVVYKNQPSQSHYESQYSLSNPTIDVSRPPSYSQDTHTNYVTETYDPSHEVNPSTLHFQTPQEDNEPQYLVGHGSQSNHKPALLQSNTNPSESQPNSGEENEARTVPETDSSPGVLLMNVPSNSFESLLSLGNTEPVSTASVSSSIGDSSNVNPDIDDQYTKPNSYNPNDNLHRIQQSSHPGMVNKASAHSSVQTSQYPGLISSSASSSTYTNGPGKPVYGGQIHQQPGAISTASAHSTYTNVQNDNDVPTPVYGEDTNNDPGFISKATAHSQYTNVQNDNDVPIPVYGGDTNNYPGLISKATTHSHYTNVQNDNDVPTPVYGGDTNNYPGLISKATTHSQYTNVQNDYGHDTNTQPDLISKVYQSVYPDVVDNYDDSIPVNGVQIQKHPGYISKTSSHSEYTIPVNHNDPTHDYEDDTDIYPGKIQNVPDYSEYTNEVNHNNKVKPVNGGPTQNVANFLVPYQPYGHKVHVIHQPSLIETTPANQNLKLKLAPTYRLFTLQNLQNLENAVIKTIQMHGSGVYNDRALVNLKKIINLILILAENLEETDGTNAWYEKIFYNAQLDSQHPLQHYVYNLIRQRWLHELMLVLYKNNFSINILQHPGIFSFLESWQFPEYVQNFMEAEDPMHSPNPQNYDDISNNQNNLQNKFTTHTYDDLLEEVPEDLENYVTKNVIDSYKSPNDGIVLSIAGVEAEPDANAIIDILQNFLHYKNYIETQENVIIHDNKVEMLRQIILFLREKGYGPNTIADLIRKLYTAVYSTEGKGCRPHHTNFSKNMYDVILPVLRRSGR